MNKAWILLAFGLLVGLGMNLAHPITPAHLRTIEVDSSMFGFTGEIWVHADMSERIGN